MWFGIFAGGFILAVLAALFLMSRALRFGFPKRIYEKNKALGILASTWPVLICLPFLFINLIAFVIAFIHLFLFWCLVDGVAFVFRKLRGRERAARYINGFIAIGLTFVYLSYGWIMAHTVLETNYEIETEKSLGQQTLRVFAIADLHAGMTLKGEELFEECERINRLSPDIVVICGDFVDDDTSREEMLEACRAMGRLKTRYGVYFVFGNHDRGYYRDKAFSEVELRENLRENGVRVLSDEVVLINDSFYIAGREDRSSKDRKSADELLSDVDKSKYIIMLDHQPNDYDAIAESGADLVISGHTHGGHIFPAGLFGYIMGANDMVYGMESVDGTTFVVTSGISGWAIPFKTFTSSEFVVIDIDNKQ